MVNPNRATAPTLMKTLSVTPKPYSESIDPSIQLIVEFRFPRGERIPLDVSAIVSSEDGRLLGVARVFQGESTNHPLEAIETGQPSARCH